ncbi:MAG: flagellar basal body L-ring protein FlgH [Thalassovita sp.]
MKTVTKLMCFGIVFLSACGRSSEIGVVPSLTPSIGNQEQRAMLDPGLPLTVTPDHAVDRASLWTSGQKSLLGDRRAIKRGDILTVVIEIDDEAEFSNSSDRSRQGSEALAVPQLFGIPQRIDTELPDGASLNDAVSLDSSSTSRGQGSVKRNEKLTLKVAATVTEVLPNGVLSIQGSQEVRVNFELRELLVTGFVRPQDISRQNQITYDKIASARVSYGGRGQITDVQQPRLGQQVLDAILPF